MKQVVVFFVGFFLIFVCTTEATAQSRLTRSDGLGEVFPNVRAAGHDQVQEEEQEILSVVRARIPFPTEDESHRNAYQLEIGHYQVPIYGHPSRDPSVVLFYGEIVKGDPELTSGGRMGLIYSWPGFGLRAGITLVSFLALPEDQGDTTRVLTPSVGVRLGGLSSTLFTFDADFHQLQLLPPENLDASLTRNVNLLARVSHPLSASFRVELSYRYRNLDFRDNFSQGLVVQDGLLVAGVEYAYLTDAGNRLMPVMVGLALGNFWNRRIPGPQVIYDLNFDGVIDDADKALDTPEGGSSLFLVVEIDLGLVGYEGRWR